MSVATVVQQWLDFRAIIICILVFLLISLWSRRPRNLPPGPWGWPILGSLPNLILTAYWTGKTQPHELLSLFANRFGEVYSMYLGNRLVVVLNTHKAIREAFNNPHVNQRPDSNVNRKLRRGQGVVLACDETWRQQRKFTLSTFSSFGIGKSRFQDQIAAEARVLAEEFNKHDGKPFNPKVLLSNATSNVICSVIFGKRYDYSDKEFQRFLWIGNRQTELIGSGVVQVFIPAFQYLQPNIEDELMKLTIEMKVFMESIISDHKKSFDPDNMRDYVDVYLNEIQQSKSLSSSSELNEMNLESTINQLFVAGTETTSTTLQWALLYLITNSDIQSRLQREIDDVVGRDRLPRLSDKAKMPYVQAVVHELQRIASIAVLGLPHLTSQDTIIRGFDVPQGSIVVPNMFKVDHDPDVWRKPFEFTPERFIDESGLFCSSENVIPFSVGRRACLGENLAKMELFIFFTHLLHQFTFKKPEESSRLTFRGVFGATYTPADYMIKAIKRI